MRDRTFRLAYLALLLTVFTIGCSSPPTVHPAADDEKTVREKFAVLQSAIKNRDAEALWELLDAKSRADAEREAKDIQTAYAKANPEEKAKQEADLGLTGTELDGLTGKGFLKTKRFQHKYHEWADSRIEKITIQGESATVYHPETDGDHEKAILVRQDGQWKVWLTMPKIKMSRSES